MLKIIQGSILDSNEDYVVHLCDCFSLGSEVEDKRFQREFFWATPYESRKQLRGSRNLATSETRDRPGTISTYDGPDRHDPTVVVMFAQLCPGRPFSGVNQKKRYKEDTAENRLEWFRSCWGKLVDLEPGSVALSYSRCVDDCDVYADVIEEFCDAHPKWRVYMFADPDMPRSRTS